MQQIISLLLENKPGALMRVTGLLSQRGYNIESLTVARTLDADAFAHDDHRGRGAEHSRAGDQADEQADQRAAGDGCDGRSGGESRDGAAAGPRTSSRAARRF